MNNIEKPFNTSSHRFPQLTCTGGGVGWCRLLYQVEVHAASMVALFILFRHNTACEYSWLCASKRQDAAVALPPWQSGETERGATACQSPAASLPSTSSVVWLRLRANLLSTHPTVQRQGRRRWSDGTQTQKETRRQREREEKGEGRKRNAALFLKRAHTHTHAYIYLFICWT